MSRLQLLQQRVLLAARNWWVSKRPKDASEKSHLSNSTVNTTTVLEHQLARAVATLVKEGWTPNETRQLVEDLLACAKGLDKGNWRTCDEVINRHEIFRRAEVFLGNREVVEDCAPQAQRPRRLVRIQSRDGSR